MYFSPLPRRLAPRKPHHPQPGTPRQRPRRKLHNIDQPTLSPCYSVQASKAMYFSLLPRPLAPRTPHHPQPGTHRLRSCSKPDYHGTTTFPEPAPEPAHCCLHVFGVDRVQMLVEPAHRGLQGSLGVSCLLVSAC